MPRSGPTTLSLPAFSGATRRLILIHLAAYFVLALLGAFAPAVAGPLLRGIVLQPAEIMHGQVWRLVTYAAVPLGVLSMLFALLTVWFLGSYLEDTRGAKWLYEIYLTSIVGGGILASAIAYTHVFHLDPYLVASGGARAGVYGLLVAFAVLEGDQEFSLFFLIRIKARYLVVIYVLLQLAMLVTENGAFNALVLLSAALAGYLFLKLVPRRGLAYGVTERYFALRNDYYRNKRRRAARKFKVYMKGQNRDVHFDSDGRYIDPDKDPTDKRWMN